MRKVVAVVWALLLVFMLVGMSPRTEASGTVDLSRGLVAYYSFDHCDARDDSGNGHDGKIYGNPKCVDGVIGKAFEFDGLDDVIKIIGDNTPSPTEAITLSLWIKPFQVSTPQGLIWKEWCGPCYSLILTENSTVQAALSYDKIHWNTKTFSNRHLLKDNWYLITFTYDGRTERIYINGELDSEKEYSNRIHADPNDPMAIGGWYRCTGDVWYYFKGLIDEVRIYNRALSDEEIRSLYLAGAGSPSLPSREEATSEYKYVFPLVYLKPMWGTSWYGSGIEVYSLEDDTKIIIDTNFNGPDSNDPTYTLKAGEMLYVGNFPHISNRQKFEWKQNPIIIYSTKPVAIDYRYLTADYGDYDDAGMRYGAPQPGTKLLGTNVRWLYITPAEKDTDVYINGQYAGHINYGEVLVKKYDSPQTVVITSSSPVVAVSAYIDPSVRSRSYAFALTPPMNGKFLIPDSIKEYALKTNAVSVNEYYTIVDSHGNVIENQSLPAEPKVVSLTDSAVFVFRIFYYNDPWRGGAPRYAMSAVAIKPAGESTLFGGIWPVSGHTVTHQVRFYAAEDVTVYMDTNGDGTIDSVRTLPAEQIYKFSDQETPVDKGTLIYVKGKLSGYSLLMGGWNGQVEGAEEISASPQSSATSSSIMGTLKISSEPSGAEVYVNGEYKGETPLTLELSQGTHTVKLTKEDYEDYIKTVTINPGETTTLSATLTPKFGYLTVYSSPSDAEVHIDGDYIGNTPVQGYKLSTGEHTVELIKEDYEDYIKTVEINPGETTTLSATLTPKFGYLTVYSSPSEAEVYVDSDYVGTTPLEDYKLSTGNHEVVVKKNEYQDYKTTVMIEPGKTEKLEVSLSKTPGTVKIISEPSGAKVYIGGDYKGETPLTLNLAPGTYDVKLTMDDYEDYTTTIDLGAGETKSISATLKPAYGYLSVESDPSGARGYIDGSYAGETPIENYKLSTGDHRVVVKKEGYNEFTKTVTIEPGKTTRVKASLSAVPATLKISSEPSGARVYVDNSYKGTTPLTLKLRMGTYTIKITKEAYEDYTTTVTLEAGKTKSISAALKPAYGYLSVESSPSGAEVYVDGNYAGRTPLENYRLKPGKHAIEIRKDGYEVYTKRVSITAGQTASISASLVAISTPETTTTTRTVHLETTTIGGTQTESPTPAGIGIKTPYIVGGILLLLILGGVAAKAVSGKSKGKPASAEAVTVPKAVEEKPKPAPAPPKVPHFPPELLDKYEPLEFLGEGGFAKVFKVKRRSDGKIIALKVPRLDEKAKKFFLKEVRAWRLLDHPNIVKLYNAFDEPLPHLEIEFVDGIKLDGELIRDLGKHPKPVDEKKAIHFIRGIAEGLKHAHSRQVFHRDLKPQNVLITSDLTPKITDWGLAKVGAISTTATTTKGLTLLYAAPEQLDDETYGHTDNRTDIYQLGLIFYELLTGKLPYQGTSPAVVMAKVINPDIKPKPPSHFNKALAKYDGIFEKLLAKRKEDRYQSVEELLSDLNLLKKLDEERRELEKTIEKTKTTMSMTTDSKELRKLKRQVVEQLSRLALIHAQLNDKAELINALEDLKAFTKEHKSEIENAISQFELMLRESIPISRLTLDELKVLLHKVQREVEG